MWLAGQGSTVGSAVGSTFDKWPAEMRFITPSFNQQAFGMMDLNSIARGTSPAFLMHTEHPSGDDYAQYLTVCAGAHDLRVRTSTEVVSIEAKGKKGGPPLFSVKTQPSQGDSQTETLGARYVVWAAGEFQYPAETSDTMAGADAEKANDNSRRTSTRRSSLSETDEDFDGDAPNDFTLSPSNNANLAALKHAEDNDVVMIQMRRRHASNPII